MCWWWWQWGLTTKEIFISWTFSNLKIFQFFFQEFCFFFCNIFLENVLFFYLSQWTLYTLWITCQKMTAFWFSIGDHTIWLQCERVLSFFIPVYMLTYIHVWVYWRVGGWLNESGFDWFSVPQTPCQLCVIYFLENFNFNFRHSQKWWLQIWQCPSCPVFLTTRNNHTIPYIMCIKITKFDVYSYYATI